MISISAAGHVAALICLSFLRFSFSPPAPALSFKPVIFAGSIPYGFPQGNAGSVIPARIAGPETGALLPSGSMPLSVPDVYIKPGAAVSIISVREPVKSLPISAGSIPRPEPVLMMHPLLPHQFGLYFKDLQEVRIELQFFIARGDARNLVSLRRKISSGNPEADLLSMRHIGHYLYIQQARFAKDSWQDVKIEFSPDPR